MAVTCDRCGRELREWPLKRPNLCSPKDWFYCIRPVGMNPSDVVLNTTQGTKPSTPDDAHILGC